MKKLHFSTTINAPAEKVWRTMLDDATYRLWTVAFSPGSYYVGDWIEGSKMLFLGPSPEGGDGGMVSRIKEYRPFEFVSIEHLGMVKNGLEDLESAEVKKWMPAFENYTLKSVDGATELVIDMDAHEDYADDMDAMWPKALQALKELAEK